MAIANLGGHVDHGEIEQAVAGAQRRLEEQEPWLKLLPRDFTTILDVGAGKGLHTKWFLDQGHIPTALDRSGTAFAYGDEIELVKGDLLDIAPDRQFDAIFCSHVLEHFPDPAAGLRKMRDLLADGGFLFVIVPPYENVSVNYHWHTGWNITQLALLLVAAGFDCSDATFTQVGLNVCGWGRKAEIPETHFNLRMSLPYLPKGMADRFYVENGFDFIPGDLNFADRFEAHRAPVAMHFDFASLDLACCHELTFEKDSWKSIERSNPQVWDFENGDWNMVIVVEGPEVAFRVAVGCGPDSSPWQESADRYVSARTGMSVHTFSARDFQNGSADMSAVRHVSVGGWGQGTSRLRFWCLMPDGNWF